ncbi:MAG: hypothetical protein D3913_15170 [Candidatus Electrothrix sp. LOE1_4_5]|nr:hypothetical protein [Candidatus Electrothrix sp. AX1]MCI5119245.1 hypothetical protein [Candidatus Electrothrix gigas]MCI5181985.1 hypothetical protein [Candidatus Electrothrix gigas]MCI5197304.1 hypothetical protein [Candidatus Electrothrix gigas]
MEKIIQELRKLVPLKETTDVGDIVLVLIEETEMISYALITGIEPDTTRKDEWWEVQMQLLSVPLQPLTWTLRTEQFTGQETFTMGGKGRFIQAVDVQTTQHIGAIGAEEKSTENSVNKGGLRLIK